MILKVICDYCGLTKIVNEGDSPSIRCPNCKSKRHIKKYAKFDGYVGCPPFESDMVKEIESYDYSSYGDISSMYD